MTTVNNTINILTHLAEYFNANNEEWQDIKLRAQDANAWFTKEHIEFAINNIANEFLDNEKLKKWVTHYNLPTQPKTVGIVMAGNIPLVGFHDLLCGIISGHNLLLKLSSKDEVLLTHICNKLIEWEPNLAKQIVIADRLNGCDAYIATGSNNTARYFEQYFGKYPNIIRKNRTSVAILDGNETDEALAALAEDVYMYYGLGCRNVTQIHVPPGYNFERILNVFKRKDYYADLNKYKNNYDYHLAIYLLNRVPYMSNESLLLVENNMPFSAVGVLHYKYYNDRVALENELKNSTDIQAIIGKGFFDFGSSQRPSLSDYPDGVDTLDFLCSI